MNTLKKFALFLLIFSSLFLQLNANVIDCQYLEMQQSKKIESVTTNSEYRFFETEKLPEAPLVSNGVGGSDYGPYSSVSYTGSLNVFESVYYLSKDIIPGEIFVEEEDGPKEALGTFKFQQFDSQGLVSPYKFENSIFGQVFKSSTLLESGVVPICVEKSIEFAGPGTGGGGVFLYTGPGSGGGTPSSSTGSSAEGGRVLLYTPSFDFVFKEEKDGPKESSRIQEFKQLLQQNFYNLNKNQNQAAFFKNKIKARKSCQYTNPYAITVT